MKFSKSVTMLFLLAVSITFMQHSYSQSTGFGIEGGLNLSNISVTPDITTNGRAGFTVGGFADIGVSRLISIRPGLRYVMKGFSSSGNGVTFTDRLGYLEIPVLLKINFPLTEVKPYIMAGPTLGIQLSASEEATNGVQTQTSDASTVFETIDFGLFFGSGLEFHIANKTDMFIGGGYSLGLSNVVKIPNISGKNSGFQFMGGFKFNI